MPDSIQHIVYRVDFARDAAECADVRTEAVTDGMHTAGSAQLSAPVGAEAESNATKHLKQRLLLKIMDRLNMSQCIIFCRTNLDCDNLETFLCNHGGGKKFTQIMETGKENKYCAACWLASATQTSDGRASLRSRTATYASSSAQTSLQGALTSRGSHSAST